MKRSDLIKQTLIKMDMDPNSTDDEYYSSYYNHLINECLAIVANTVLPYQKKIKATSEGNDIVEIPRDFMSFSNEARPKLIKSNGEIDYDATVIYLSSKELMLPESGEYLI
jgi:hypothetical protein